MKNRILFWIVTSWMMVQFAHAQTPNYLAATSKWRINSVGLSMINPCWIQSKYVVEITGDTTLSGIEYKKLIYHGEQTELPLSPTPGQTLCSPPSNFSYLYAFIRQEGKKLYIREIYEDVDSLLYDFDLEIGDTLPLSYTNSSTTITVEGISTIQVGNETRKVFELSENTNNINFIIEGIGHENGLIGPMQPFEFFESGLVCFQLNGTTYFSNTTEECEMRVGLETLDADFNFVVFPNPANASISIQPAAGSHEPISISICDASGRVVFTQYVVNTSADENLVLDISNFQVGFYILAVTAGDKKQSTYFLKN